MKNRLIMLLLVIALVLLTTILFQSCAKTWTTTTILYQVPNWTSDGNIVFLENIIFSEHEKKFLFPESGKMTRQELWLWECNSDGTNMNRVGLLLSGEPTTGNPTNTSSAGDWLVLSISETNEIYIVNRDGTGFEEVANGKYPDFSPDAKKIVYEKSYGGIWIMDKVGQNDHAVWGNSLNGMPAWSTDGSKIAFVRRKGWQDEDLWSIDTSGGNSEKLIDGISGLQPDWAPVDTNAILFCGTGSHTDLLYLDSGVIRELDGLFQVRWSPNGRYFLGTNVDGIFVMEVDGSNKIHLRP